MAGNANSGRRPRTVIRAAVQQTIDAASPKCASILVDFIEGRKELSPAQLDAVKYILNQHIGMPKQRHDIETDNYIQVSVLYGEIIPAIAEVTPVEVEELPVADPVPELQAPDNSQ